MELLKKKIIGYLPCVVKFLHGLDQDVKIHVKPKGMCIASLNMYVYTMVHFDHGLLSCHKYFIVLCNKLYFLY